MGKRILVLDADGELLGKFADTYTAHLWSHYRILAPGFDGHVEVFDPHTRTSLVVGTDECRSIIWGRIQNTSVSCDERAGSDDPGLPVLPPRQLSRRSVAHGWLTAGA
ncbi:MULTISPECIES: hypothetical protein [unclassified Frankia]|uniref:hypothetical protein n=1 Tax=unclassified Frankia TaxID=2632575 RepID=UPI001EF3EB30|nr:MULTISPECIES: hypothetical protein [unclassified Frankia]